VEKHHQMTNRERDICKKATQMRREENKEKHAMHKEENTLRKSERVLSSQDEGAVRRGVHWRISKRREMREISLKKIGIFSILLMITLK